MNSAIMEQTKYWMWARRKFNNNITTPHLFNPSISANSWEDQTFAEDSAGLLGGCMWPPRSYTCSFCQREFRSAQALGGHMNVHRRDRARLKQSSSPVDHESPDQASTLVYYIPNPNPNSNPNPDSGIIGSSLSSTSLVSPPYCFTNSIPVRVTSALELNLGLGNLKGRVLGSKGKRDWEKDDEVMSNNKRRTDDVVLSSISKPSSGEVLKLNATAIEEIDLELRLGDPPKVK